MSYLDAATVHARPVVKSPYHPEPASILFPRGPEWTRRYQRNRASDTLDSRFMYKDQGPPMYRLLGAHYSLCQPPTNYHTYAKAYYYEPRLDNVPNPKNRVIAFPPGPPPAQVALFDKQRTCVKSYNDPPAPEIPGRTLKSIKAWDKYRYLPGPPTETDIYGTMVF